VAGAAEQNGTDDESTQQLLAILLDEGVAVSRAAAGAARVTGQSKRALYAQAQALHDALEPKAD
jgi:hypothetical protein